MKTTNGVLVMVSDPALRDEVDRVGAAAGARMVHADASGRPRSKGWVAAAAVVLDVAAACRCAEGGLPRRGRVVVVTPAEPADVTWKAAISTGAQQVLTLPGQADQLICVLSEAGGSGAPGAGNGAVAAVIGGHGGAGASTFAAALALAAGDALLVDVDPWGGGIDLLLGTEEQPGLRWPDVTVERGRIGLPALREALPARGGVGVLSGARRGRAVDAGPLAAVIDAGRRGGTTVVCDLPRRLTPAVETALDAADLVVLLARCDVRGCAATASIAPALCAVNPNVGLVVRGPSPGGLRARDVETSAALPLLAAMRPEPRLAEHIEHRGLRLRPRSALAVAVQRVLEVLRAHMAAPDSERAA